MNETTEQLKRHAEKISLTEQEKQRMRSIIGAHMKAHPKGYAIRSPYLRSTLLVRIILVPALCAVVVFGGFAYAAEGALPGDLLYGFRVHVNEAMRVTLAPSSAGKAEVEARIAKQRVSEAQALEARGALNSVLAQKLEDDFNTHAQAALQFAEIADQKKQSSAKKNTVETPATSTPPEKSVKNLFGLVTDTRQNTQQKDLRASVSSKIKNSLKDQSQFFTTFRTSLSHSNNTDNKKDTPVAVATSSVAVDKTEGSKIKKVTPSKKFMNATTPGSLVTQEPPIVVPPPATTTQTSSATSTATTSPSTEATSTPTVTVTPPDVSVASSSPEHK